ncbi:MAG: hypothetical protein RIC14_07830 [Filomicrobium sp.]
MSDVDSVLSELDAIVSKMVDVYQESGLKDQELKAAWEVFEVLEDEFRNTARNRLDSTLAQMIERLQLVDGTTIDDLRGGVSMYRGVLARLAAETSTTSSSVLIDPALIVELDKVNWPGWDTLRAVTLCRELNSCYQSESVLACCILSRALCEHLSIVYLHYVLDQRIDQISSVKSAKPFKVAISELRGQLRSGFEQFERNIHLTGNSSVHAAPRRRERFPSMFEVSSFSTPLNDFIRTVIQALESKK